MSKSRRRRPLAQFEFGTRIYAPTTDDARYRVVTRDPNGTRHYARTETEKEARARARDFERVLQQAGAARAETDFAYRTVAILADRYVSGHLPGLSLHFRERQEWKLRNWVLPQIGHLHVIRSSATGDGTSGSDFERRSWTDLAATRTGQCSKVSG